MERSASEKTLEGQRGRGVEAVGAGLAQPDPVPAAGLADLGLDAEDAGRDRLAGARVADPGGHRGQVGGGRGLGVRVGTLDQGLEREVVGGVAVPDAHGVGDERGRVVAEPGGHVVQPHALAGLADAVGEAGVVVAGLPGRAHPDPVVEEVLGDGSGAVEVVEPLVAGHALVAADVEVAGEDEPRPLGDVALEEVVDPLDELAQLLGADVAVLVLGQVGRLEVGEDEGGLLDGLVHPDHDGGLGRPGVVAGVGAVEELLPVAAGRRGLERDAGEDHQAGVLVEVALVDRLDDVRVRAASAASSGRGGRPR